MSDNVSTTSDDGYAVISASPEIGAVEEASVFGNGGKVLIIEPFYGGSHKAFIDTITKAMDPEKYTLLTLPAKKWPWRARCGALLMYVEIPDLTGYTTLFSSCVLNLCELIGLKPELAKLKKIVYFHENQLVYPVCVSKDRDYQFGYNQITTCLAADVIAFNSEYNKNTFLGRIEPFVKKVPNYRLKHLRQVLEPKCVTWYYPVEYESIDAIKAISAPTDGPIRIVWPHRWEHDKNPELAIDTLIWLKENGVPFKVSFLGERFSSTPICFDRAQEELADEIIHFGYLESRIEYMMAIAESDIVLSTAEHEFFGVAVVECVRAGCLPVLPNKLVYPEFYPSDCLYDSEEDLRTMLKLACMDPVGTRMAKQAIRIDLERFNANPLSAEIVQKIG